ncbi:MAG: type II toxin-antitoxin system PemK/MazF family toxin [Caldilineaceae bacterium]
MVIPARGEIWWADLGEPRGSTPGYRRPVLIVQDDHFNRSDLATVIVLSLTSNLKYAAIPGNVFLPKELSGLAKDSVINITQLTTIDKAWLDEFISELPNHMINEMDRSLGLVLNLS